MSDFSNFTWKEVDKFLIDYGCTFVRQKGSHVIMQHPTKSEQLTVAFHAGKEVKKGLLTAILKQANIKTAKR